MADAATPAPAAATPDDAAKRLKAHVEQLIARPAAESSGSVQLAGRSFDYTVHAAFVRWRPPVPTARAASPMPR